MYRFQGFGLRFPGSGVWVRFEGLRFGISGLASPIIIAGCG